MHKVQAFPLPREKFGFRLLWHVVGAVDHGLIFRYFMHGADPFGIKQPLAADRVRRSSLNLEQ